MRHTGGIQGAPPEPSASGTLPVGDGHELYWEDHRSARWGTLRRAARWARQPIVDALHCTRASGDGARVEITATDVPDGISEGDHAAGLASSLENLARFATTAA
jgi:hypothetical protein